MFSMHPFLCQRLTYFETYDVIGRLFLFAFIGKSKSKKAKHASAVEPLQEGEEVTDTAGKKWKLVKLLSQSTTELLYEGETGSGNTGLYSNYISGKR